MFDIGFFEILLIAVVGLVVIGPEKLPGAIRTGALWFGRIKRTLRETRTEVEKQLGADEIRQELHNEQVMANLEKLRNVHTELESKIMELGDDRDDTTRDENDAARDEYDEYNHDEFEGEQPETIEYEDVDPHSDSATPEDQNYSDDGQYNDRHADSDNASRSPSAPSEQEPTKNKS